MATQSIGNLALKMSMSAGQFHAEMDKAMSKMEKMERQQEKATKSGNWTSFNTGVTATIGVFNTLTGAVSTFSSAVSGALSMAGDLASSVVAIGTDAVQVYARFETMGNAFSVMMGSADKAQDLMGRIMEAAAATPFESKDITQGIQRFAAYGMSAEKAFNSLMDMRNVLASSPNNMTETLQRVTLALGQVYGKGALAAQELNQLNEAGVGGRKIITDYLAATGRLKTSSFEELMESRQISSADVFAAFKMANEGRLGGLSQLQSKSVEGLTSTLNDSITLFKSKLGEGLVQGLDIRGILGDLAGQIDQAANSVGKLQPALELVGGALKAIRDVGAAAFTDLLASIDQASAGFEGGKTASEGWYDATIGFIEETSVAFVEWGNTIIDVVSKAIKALGLLVSAGEAATGSVRGAVDYLNPTSGNRTVFSDLWDIGSYAITGEMATGRGGLLGDQAGGAGSAIAGLGEMIGKLRTGSGEGVRDWFAAFRGKAGSKTTILDTDREAMFKSARDALAGIAEPDREVAGYQDAYGAMKDAIYNGADALTVFNGYQEALDVAMRNGAITTDEYSVSIDKFATVLEKAGLKRDKLLNAPKKIRMFDLDPNEDWEAQLEKRAGKFRGIFKDPVRELQDAVGEINELAAHGKLGDLDKMAALAKANDDFEKAVGAKHEAYKPPTAALQGSREALSAELSFRARQMGASSQQNPVDRVRVAIENQKRLLERAARAAEETARKLQPVPVVGIN